MKLIIAVGLPGSGKPHGQNTTALFHGQVVTVCSDNAVEQSAWQCILKLSHWMTIVRRQGKCD